MINFTLHPASGHANAYFDVKFSISSESKIEEIRIYNKQARNQQLDVLAVVDGYIQNGNLVKAEGAESASGYINLFNNDKSNSQLDKYTNVDIRCEVLYLDGKKESESVTFYNESQSLDMSVIPFDLNIDNPHIDIKNNLPLRLQAISHADSKYELCILSEDKKVSSPFEVILKKGKNTINFPSEVIFSDLELDKNFTKKFSIYYVKFEGRDHKGYKNRKYIPIANTDLSFNSHKLHTQPQTKNDPSGRLLPEDFILSDRYFIPVSKEYSALSNKSNFTPQKLHNFTAFMHEAQNMQSIDKAIEFSTKGRSPEIKKSVFHNEITQKTAKMMQSDRKEVQAFATKYTKSSASSQPATINQTKKGGCGCTRKRING